MGEGGGGVMKNVKKDNMNKDCNGCFGAAGDDCQRCPPSNKQDQIQDNQIDQITYGCKEEQKLFEEAEENE